MRPIVHPPQPAANVYPQFRLDTQAHLETDLQAYPWTTTSPIPTDYFGAVIDADDALRRTLLELILHPPPPPPKKPPKKKKKTVTLALVAHYAALLRDRIYPQANTPLYAALGRYCSYCEQKLTETIAVEHVAPKAGYPMTSVCWNNFLLSCRACNSRKDEQPARTAAWMPVGGDEVDRYKAIRLHYLFPDTSLSAYWSLLPVLYAFTGGAYQAVDDAVSVDDALVATSKGDPFTKTPRAQVPFTAGTQTVNVLAYLVPTVDPTRVTGLPKAQASFQMIGLDNQGIGSSDDNRMWDRTVTWLTAVRAFRLLDATNDFPTMWESLCELAGQTGFLTTWIRVLQLRGGAAAPYPPPPAAPTSNLLAQFLQVMTQGAHAPYPGTDLTCLP